MSATYSNPGERVNIIYWRLPFAKPAPGKLSKLRHLDARATSTQPVLKFVATKVKANTIYQTKSSKRFALEMVPTMEQVNVVSEGDESVDASSSSLYAADDTSTYITSCPSLTDLDFVRRKSPYQFDVLCGRGRGFYTHPGNRRMLDIVAPFKEEYRVARKLDKCRVAKRVLDNILLGYHPKPDAAARDRQVKKPLKFWRRAEDGEKDTVSSGLSHARHQWVELSEIEAQKKVAHTLRETRSTHIPACAGRRRGKRNTTRARKTTGKVQGSTRPAKKKTSSTGPVIKKASLTLRAVPGEIGKSGNEKILTSFPVLSTTSSSFSMNNTPVPKHEIPPPVLAELDELDLDLLEGRYHEVDIYGTVPTLAYEGGEDDVSLLEWESV